TARLSRRRAVAGGGAGRRGTPRPVPRLPRPARRRARADHPRRRATRTGGTAGPRAPAVSSGRREASHPLVVEGAPAARVGRDLRLCFGTRDIRRLADLTGPGRRAGTRHT